MLSESSQHNYVAKCQGRCPTFTSWHVRVHEKKCDGHSEAVWNFFRNCRIVNQLTSSVLHNAVSNCSHKCPEDPGCSYVLRPPACIVAITLPGCVPHKLKH